jgi:hypothetical protein
LAINFGFTDDGWRTSSNKIGVILIDAKYKTYLYTAIIAFIVGYAIAGWQGRAGLYRLQVRTNRYETLSRHYQAREAGFTERLKELQNQLAASRSAAAELGESIKRAQRQTKVAIGRTQRVGNALEGIAGIVRAIEKRGSN